MGAGPSAERTQGPPGQEYSEAKASLFNAAMKPRNKGLELIANELQLGAQPDQYRHHMVVDLHPLTVPTCTYRRLLVGAEKGGGQHTRDSLHRWCAIKSVLFVCASLLDALVVVVALESYIHQNGGGRMETS